MLCVEGAWSRSEEAFHLGCFLHRCGVDVVAPSFELVHLFGEGQDTTSRGVK